MIILFRININLPDEIILIIWNKLNEIDVLYSFLNVIKRFDKLIRDKIYIHSIELIKTSCEEKDNCSLSDQILDRFCLDILPQIHYIVEKLILASLSMKRIKGEAADFVLSGFFGFSLDF